MKPEIKAGFIICHDTSGDMQAICIKNIATFTEGLPDRKHATFFMGTIREEGVLNVKGTFFDYLELLIKEGT